MLFNFTTDVSAGATGIELGVGGAAHALMLARIVSARRSAARQRPADLERFRQIKSARPDPAPR
ncbi:MAG: hypothetical protein A3G76_14775 [Acidobacteria bacterium RIFCSPLOWO2_12_FULL_65_11]|nr:MAG: hypothetical protein A3H95_09080 [Acidobacteria bacterium RIFCSPLOWO2_02_FULL_64_15]OFW30981.1 MAG: hypothetical protein A3G76_14775 [Acidobacteria bacterium RIFCSPLOWO2_12_FULL_65_11]